VGLQHPMRVQFQISGGVGFFPGLAARRTIDAETLPAHTQRVLADLVEETQFFSLPAQVSAAPGSADHQTYRITIEDRARHHTIVVSDPVAGEPLQRLIDLLRSL
jgi:hypothetical protein